MSNSPLSGPGKPTRACLCTAVVARILAKSWHTKKKCSRRAARRCASVQRAQRCARKPATLSPRLLRCCHSLSPAASRAFFHAATPRGCRARWPCGRRRRRRFGGLCRRSCVRQRRFLVLRRLCERLYARADCVCTGPACVCAGARRAFRAAGSLRGGGDFWRVRVRGGLCRGVCGARRTACARVVAARRVVGARGRGGGRQRRRQCRRRAGPASRQPRQDCLAGAPRSRRRRGACRRGLWRAALSAADSAPRVVLLLLLLLFFHM